MNRFLLGGAIVLGLAATAHGARAGWDTVPGWPAPHNWQSGGFFGGAGFRYTSLGMPNFTGIKQRLAGTVQSGAVVDTQIDRQSIYGPEAHLGFVFAPGTLPPWLGLRPRLQIFGGWQAGTTSTSGEPTTVSDFANYGIDGRFIVNNGAVGTVTASLRTHTNQYRLGLRGSSDFEVTPAFTLTPSISIYGARTSMRHEYAELCPCGPVTAVNDFINARVRWTDFGGDGGLKLAYAAMPWLVFHAEGHVGLAHRHASLSASQVFNTPSGAPDRFRSASDSKNRLAFRTGGELGVTALDGNWLALSLSAGADFDNRVPGYAAPVIGNVNGAAGSPAALKFTSEVNWNVQARVVIRIW